MDEGESFTSPDTIRLTAALLRPGAPARHCDIAIDGDQARLRAAVGSGTERHWTGPLADLGHQIASLDQPA